MRREGFEFAVSPPRVVYRTHEGQRQEPMEEVHCEVEDAHAGSVIESLSLRRAELVEMIPLQVGDTAGLRRFSCRLKHCTLSLHLPAD